MIPLLRSVLRTERVCFRDYWVGLALTTPGDMNKPIYRHYAEAKWRSYDQRLINQRIKQFNIVPDVLPKLEPTADVQLYFRQLNCRQRC